MVNYLVMRLEMGKMNYNTVIAKYPQYKEEIDEALDADGYIVLPDGRVVKRPEE